MIKIQTFVFNPVQVNTYVLWDETGECAIVDAGCYTEKEFSRLDNFISSNQLKPVRLINTHGHFDHLFGVERCRKTYGLTWEAHPADADWIGEVQARAAMLGIPADAVALPETILNQGDNIVFGTSLLRVIHVPGHSPGSVCFYEAASGILISGDVLFKGSIGRTDLAGGDFNTLISGITENLLILPNNTIVYPGHGPATTIGDEKARNPYLQ